jgi:hypothetical protein
MIPLVEGEAQAAGDGGDHLLGRLRTAPLLQTGVVVGGHGRKAGDLFSPETGDTATLTPGQPHVLGLQRFASFSQKVGKPFAVHFPIVGVLMTTNQGSLVPGWAVLSRFSFSGL